jgi:hypothetical protein
MAWYSSSTINISLTQIVIFFEHIISKRTPLILSEINLCRKIIYAVANYNAVDAGTFPHLKHCLKQG